MPINKDARTFDDTLDALRAREQASEAMEQVWELSRALSESIESILDDEEVADKQGMIAQSVAQFRAAINDFLPDLDEVEKRVIQVRKTNGGTGMENMTAIEKDVIALCALVESARREEDLEVLNRSTFEEALDSYVGSKLKPDETRPAAHARLHAADPIYKKLAFGARYAKPNFIDVPQPQATVKTSSAEQGLEALAKSNQRPGQSYAAAYSAALETPEGRKLYAETRKSKAAGGAEPTD